MRIRAILCLRRRPEFKGFAVVVSIALLSTSFAATSQTPAQPQQPPKPQNPVVSAISAMEVGVSSANGAPSSVSVVPELFTGSATGNFAIPIPDGRAHVQ